MSKALMATGSVEPISKGEQDGLTKYATEKLGDQNSAPLGTACVNRTGFQFFDPAGKPKTAWVLPGTKPADVMTVLFGQGNYDLKPAYQVELDDPKHTIALGEYHTQRVFGTAPALEIGSVIEVFAAKNKGGIAYAYRTPKNGN